MVQKMFDRCCGCGACENVCPMGAIHYDADCNGFYKPFVDEEKCIHCGLCLKKCPLDKELHGTVPKAVYVCRNQSLQILNQSSSGGVFAPLAQKVLEEGGYVFGCCWDGLAVRHVEISDSAGIEKLCKSKYLQSDMSGVHMLIKKRLDEGKKVLFCGTPCQVAGLKTDLGERCSNLLTVDFICHGVPSVKVFNKYIQELEATVQASVSSVCFRDKQYGWKELQLTALFSDRTQYSAPAGKDHYYRAFLCNLSLNKNCGECQFNCIPRISDITMGDFWNVDKHHDRFDDNLGTSCVILNSDAGASLFQSIQDHLTVERSSVEAVLDGNPFLNGHCTLHKRRDTFFANLDSQPFGELVDRCLKPTPLEWLVEVAKYKLHIK